MQTASGARSRPLILDGALGTELERRGFETTLPLWSAKALIENPGLIWEIHKDYVEAGADVLSACTFRTTPYTLRKVGLEHRAEELTHQAIRYARAASIEHTDQPFPHSMGEGSRMGVNARAATTENPKSQSDQILSSFKFQVSSFPCVAGSIAPLEDCYHPELAPARDILKTEHTRFAKLLADAGADLLLVETQNSAREALIAAEAALATGLPVWVSLMPKSATEIFNGDSLAEAARELHRLGVAVILVNCAPPAIAAAAFGVLTETLPDAKLGLYPNLLNSQATSPESTFPHSDWGRIKDGGGKTDQNNFAAWLSRFAPPASVLGGCCGTTPDHIAELANAVNTTTFHGGERP